MASRDVTREISRGMALRRALTFTRCSWKYHVIIVIKIDLPGFVVTMHSGLCEEYPESPGLTASGFDFLVARALVHADNKPLPSRF